MSNGRKAATPAGQRDSPRPHRRSRGGLARARGKRPPEARGPVDILVLYLFSYKNSFVYKLKGILT